MPDPRESILAGILDTPTVWLQLDAASVDEIALPFSGAEKRLGRRSRTADADADADEAEVPRLPLSSRLRRAFEEGAFSVVYQPQVETDTGLVMGVEALLRWSDPAKEAGSPADFVPILERTGLIGAVGEWVLREACTRIRHMSSRGRPLILSVNLSPRQFSESGLVDRIATVLEQCRFPANRLEVEITESMIENLEYARQTIVALRALGVRVVIDDFGIGYSSLNHLKLLPVAGLKLDRSFVAGMLANRHDKLITESIIHLARELNLEVVAEGVEDVAHERWLRQRGVQRLQGFLFSPGVSAARLSALLRKQPFARAPAGSSRGKTASAGRRRA